MVLLLLCWWCSLWLSQLPSTLHLPFNGFPSSLCRDSVRGLAKAKAKAAELLATCAGVPDAPTSKAGSSGRTAEVLAAFTAFHAEVAALAAAGGAPAQQVLAACDR